MVRARWGAAAVAVVLVPLAGAPAQADVGGKLTRGGTTVTVSVDQPDTVNGTSRVRLSAVAETSAEIHYVTYRAIDDPAKKPSIDTVCGASLADSKLPVLWGPVTPAGEKLTKTKIIELKLHVYCFYVDRDGVGTPEAAEFVYGWRGGSFTTSPIGKPTAVSMTAERLNDGTYYVLGATAGPKKGSVKLQRYRDGAWVTVAKVALKDGVYRGAVKARKGDRIRAVFAPPKPWLRSVSPAVRAS